MKEEEDERPTIGRQALGDQKTLLDRLDGITLAPPATRAIEQLRAASDAPAERYCVLDEIGRGGMGEVTRIFDSKIGREIAMKKMLPMDPATESVLRGRFLREARVQALLDHPAIVPVYDIGLAADGLAFFTMKRIRGETFFRILSELGDQRQTTRSHKLGLRRRLVPFVMVCQAVQYAHERGVVHRDLKPENIMMGAHGEVYVLDWGVAKLLTGATEGVAPPFDSEPTRQGEMIGTPGFMPPEQVLGVHAEVDARSDIYALGAILYEIVALKPLHDAPDVMGTLESTLNPQGPRVSPPPDAPVELVALALRCTRFNKAERPTSVAELIEGIERYLDGDRDDQLRTKLADERTMRARADLEQALAGPPAGREAARAAALQEAGRALALHPEHAEAARVVLELISSVPDPPPAEALAEVEVLERQHRRRAMRDNALRLALWGCSVPLVLAMSVRIPALAAVIVVLLAVAIVWGAMLARTDATSAGARLGLYAIAFATIGGLSAVFGPLMLLPGLASMNSIVFGAQSKAKERPLIVLMGLLSIAVPLGLELAGVVPPSMVFAGGSLVIVPRLTEFPRTMTLAVLISWSLFGVLTPTFVVGRMKDALAKAERDLVLQKWQLQQLSPRGRSATRR